MRSCGGVSHSARGGDPCVRRLPRGRPTHRRDLPRHRGDVRSNFRRGVRSPHGRGVRSPHGRGLGSPHRGDVGSAHLAEVRPVEAAVAEAEARGRCCGRARTPSSWATARGPDRRDPVLHLVGLDHGGQPRRGGAADDRQVRDAPHRPVPAGRPRSVGERDRRRDHARQDRDPVHRRAGPAVRVHRVAARRPGRARGARVPRPGVRRGVARRGPRPRAAAGLGRSSAAVAVASSLDPPRRTQPLRQAAHRNAPAGSPGGAPRPALEVARPDAGRLRGVASSSTTT